MAWLTGWAKRVKITVDSGDIDSNLSHFPVLVYLSTSSGINSEDISFVFDELTADANRKKIALTKSDGTTELYCEIEEWDDANEEAWLWVSGSGWTVNSGSDTDLYLYYDSSHADNTTYVGDPNSSPAESVWDSNFELVTHMRDDPDTSHVRDSTSNDNDGTKTGANEPQVTTSGKISDAQTHDGSNDKIDVSDVADLRFGTNDFTIEAWVNLDAAPLTDYPSMLGKGDTFGGEWMFRTWGFAATPEITFYGDAEWIMRYQGAGADLRGAGWKYLAFKRVGNNWYFRLDGSQVDTNTNMGGKDFSTSKDLQIGCADSSATRYWDGSLDEIRVSPSLGRSDAWLKASYETQRDHLLDYGSEETAPSEAATPEAMLGPPVPKPDFPIGLLALVRDYLASKVSG